jgi:hypothetical protein
MSVTAKAVGLPNKNSSATDWLVLNIDDAATDLDDIPLCAARARTIRCQVPAGHRAYSRRKVRTEKLVWRPHYGLSDLASRLKVVY